MPDSPDTRDAETMTFARATMVKFLAGSFRDHHQRAHFAAETTAILLRAGFAEDLVAEAREAFDGWLKMLRCDHACESYVWNRCGQCGATWPTYADRVAGGPFDDPFALPAGVSR